MQIPVAVHIMLMYSVSIDFGIYLVRYVVQWLLYSKCQRVIYYAGNYLLSYFVTDAEISCGEIRTRQGGR